MAPRFCFEQVQALTPEQRGAWLESLTAEQRAKLPFLWSFWARPNQLIPTNVNPRTEDGGWTTWLVKAGRGFGKTRTGAEATRKWARDYPLVNLIGATADDARDIMIEGESGILAICPPHERPEYLPSKRRLEWPNGSKSLIFTADEPERLRGKQHMKVWADEVAAWRYREAWDQLVMGLRLGRSPQIIATTTPRPTALIKEIMADPSTLVTHGTTYDNRANLAETFFSKIIKKYEGTRLGRQELNAEVLEDNPGALWSRRMIEDSRVSALPDGIARVATGVDPAVTAHEDSDLTGIVTACRDNQDPAHYYVIADASLIASPDAWAKQIVQQTLTHGVDRVVAEVNNGGDLVEAVLRHADPNISFKAVHATRGKVLRAEPIAALYEQGRVHHVGCFPELEDQMCDYNPLTSTKSPDRMDALVWALTALSDEPESFGLLRWIKQSQVS